MKDPLNEQEREVLESVRHRWQHERSDAQDMEKLLFLIDTLIARTPKKRTKAELRTAFEATFKEPPRKIFEKPIRYEESELNAELGGWFDAIDFVGLLEKE